VKLVHLVGFIIKKFFMMHSHTNVKYDNIWANNKITSRKAVSKIILPP